MKLTIMTPIKRVFQGDVAEVYLPGIRGEFGVLPEHAQLVSKISVGICKYKNQQGIAAEFLLGKGVARINEDNVEVLTELVERKGMAKLEEVRSRIDEISKELARDDLTDEERENLLEEIELQNARLDLLT